MKIIKKLGSGYIGTVYLVEKDNKKYAMKIQKIPPEQRNKNFKYELWRELDFYNYVNKMNKNDIGFFNKLYSFKIYDKCDHIQDTYINSPREDLNDFFEILKKSEWCSKFVIEYKSDINFKVFLATKKLSYQNYKSFFSQIIKIFSIQQKGGYFHDDLHNENIMVKKTNNKYFTIDNKKISFQGFQLSAIDYGLILHKKYKLNKNYNYKMLIKNPKRMYFEKIKEKILVLILNIDKHSYWYEKKNKTEIWDKNPHPFDSLIKKIIKNHFSFWKNAKNRYIKVISHNKDTLAIMNKIENSKKTIHFIIEKHDYKEKNENNIWLLLNIIANEFYIYNTKLHEKYFGWNYHFDLPIPKKIAFDILNCWNLEDLTNCILKWKTD